MDRTRALDRAVNIDVSHALDRAVDMGVYWYVHPAVFQVVQHSLPGLVDVDVRWAVYTSTIAQAATLNVLRAML